MQGFSLATPDQTLVVSLGGAYELECFDRGLWRRALQQPGSAGFTPGGETDRLRRRPRGPDPIRTAHVYLPAALVHDAVAHAVHALVHAVEGGAPDLYAAAVTVARSARSMSTLLVQSALAWSRLASKGGGPGKWAEQNGRAETRGWWPETRRAGPRGQPLVARHRSRARSASSNATA